MSTNPYAGALGGAEPLAVLAATGERLKAVLAKTADADAPLAPGKWSLREVMVHLADCEMAFGFRLRQALAGVEIQPFDQTVWAESYARYPMAAAMETLGALRAWNLAFAHGLSAEDRAVTVLHPERGQTSVWTVLETMAGHDLHHLATLE